MLNECAAVLAALLLSAGSLPLGAEEVKLTSGNGEFEISGNLLGFDGDFYRLDTVYGELTVDSAGVSCEGAGCPDLAVFVAELRMSGEAAMGRLMMPALLEAFALRMGYDTETSRSGKNGFLFELIDQKTKRTVARFEFAATTSDEGFADLLANQADIVLSTREIRPDERKLARDAGMGDLSAPNRSRVLALDAIVPIVSAGNPVERISPMDLARAVAGKLTNWSELGGPDASIALHLPEARTGLGQTIEDRLMKPAGLGFSSETSRHSHSLDIAGAVENGPWALGVASFAETGNARVLTVAGDCGFGVEASRRGIKTEDYPLTAPLFLYLPARRLPKVGREFLAFLRAPSAQLVIRRAGFVDQTPEEIGIEVQGRRIANAIAAAGAEIRLEELQRMIATLAPMRRLTTSFRFETGSVRLDAQSRSNVQQLARALEQGKYDSMQLLFVGFSDGEGAAEGNRDIALRRAEAVRRGVAAAADRMEVERVRMDVDAFGEALPLACDDTAWGRQANRRVEVWVR